jgi:hypothetical protein
MSRTSFNNYQINNYNIDNYKKSFNSNIDRPGVVLQQQNIKEDEQNKLLFDYAIPKPPQPACLNIDMRPQETRHDLLGINICDNIRNKYSNTNTYSNNDLKMGLQHNACSIDPFIPSWVKYSASINNESDLKNIFRKKSCDPNSVYIPSSNSVMYSKEGMPSDNILNSGYNVLLQQENKDVYPNFFMEDTRQERMGKLYN